jgi:hypothetical protein
MESEENRPMAEENIVVMNVTVGILELKGYFI